MLFHDGQMESVTRRQAPMAEDNLLGALRGGLINVQHLIDDAQQGIEGRLDGVPAVDRNVAMQNLLQNLGVGHKPLALRDQLLEQPLRVALMGVRRAYEIHGDI